MQQVAEEAILDHFRNPEHEPFHPDFLEHVILDEHRGVIGRAVMALVNKRLIVKCGRRKSTIASRKGAEANEYRLTELGRDRITRIGTGSQRLRDGGARLRPPASADSGDRSTAGVGTKNREGTASSNRAALDRPASSSRCMEASPTGARSSLGVDPGDGSSVHGRQRAHDAGGPRPIAEPLSLLPEPDPEAWAA